MFKYVGTPCEWICCFCLRLPVLQSCKAIVCILSIGLLQNGHTLTLFIPGILYNSNCVSFTHSSDHVPVSQCKCHDCDVSHNYRLVGTISPRLSPEASALITMSSQGWLSRTSATKTSFIGSPCLLSSISVECQCSRWKFPQAPRRMWCQISIYCLLFTDAKLWYGDLLIVLSSLEFWISARSIRMTTQVRLMK